MLTYNYNSSADDVSAKKQPKKKRILASPIAEDTFAVFQPFINVFDCGGNYDGPYHLISKEDWALYRRHQAGEKNLCYPNGTKFNPYIHVVQNIFTSKHIEDHIVNNETRYYTSSKKGLGLLYLDVDAHHPWQTDEAKAKAFLQKLFPFGYYRASFRGQNSYLKIRYSSIAEFNEVGTRLQAVLQRAFLHAGILCDIEVKGTITHKGTSGKLAKLPFNTKDPADMRDDTDCWNYTQLEKFKNCEIVNMRRIGQIAEQLKKSIDEDAVAKGQQRKEKEIGREKLIADVREKLGFQGTDDKVLAQFKKLLDEQRQKGLVEVKNGKTILKFASENENNPAVEIGSHKTLGPKVPNTASYKKSSSNVAPGQCEGDAFERNKKDLLPFVRDFYKRHRSLPTVADALEYLQKNGLFSGNWEDNEQRRAKRVEQILNFVVESFDPTLMKSGDFEPVVLSRGNFSWWVRSKFGSKIKAQIADLQGFDPVTMTTSKRKVLIPAKFVETFLIVVDFCLNQDPLVNKAVPTNRIKKIWEMVAGGAAWNQTYFQIVRDRLNKLGVVNIVDRHHEKGKAWRWETGTNFPAKTWKEDQRILKNQVKRLRTGLSYKAFVANTKFDRKDELLNTLYESESQIFQDSVQNEDVRPPPDG